MLCEDNSWAMRKDMDYLLHDGPCLRWVNNMNQIGWKESLRWSSPEDAGTGRGQFGDLLIERVPYAVQPECRLNEALLVCEPSWNLPARTPAVISLYLWEKPKMKTCLVQDSSLPGPTHGICCFWTTERAEGLLFLPRNPLLRCDFHIWRTMV